MPIPLLSMLYGAVSRTPFPPSRSTAMERGLTTEANAHHEPYRQALGRLCPV